MVYNFTYPLEGVYGLEIFDHCIFVINLAEPGRLATRCMRGALFRHCVDGAVGRTEPGDIFLFNFVQSEDEVLCLHGDCLVQDGAGVGFERWD